MRTCLKLLLYKLFSLILYRKTLKNYYNVYINHDYCYAEMPKEHNKIWKYNLGEMPIKVPFIIYADLESLLEKMSSCHSNPEKSSTILRNHK